MYKNPNIGTSPFLNLAPLLELPLWTHAVRSFDNSGTLLPLAQLLKAKNGDEIPLILNLNQVSEAFSSGLPLELGFSTTRMIAELTALDEILRHRKIPWRGEMLERLRGALTPFALNSDGRTKPDGWKSKVILDRDELARQACLIDDLLRKNLIASALGLMAEWTISRTILQVGDATMWLKYDTRRKANDFLNSRSEMLKDDVLKKKASSEDLKLGALWSNLGRLRNAFHHHGMRPQFVSSTATKDIKEALSAVKKTWDSLRAETDFGEKQVQSVDMGLMMVSPLGRLDGVLQSALHIFSGEYGRAPDEVAVICSKETIANVNPLLNRANFHGHCICLELNDPYGGDGEVEGHVRQLRPLFLSNYVVVNLTGGTTLMGILAAKIADEARRFACLIGSFGLIDKRPHAEQVAHPDEKSAAFWIEGPEILA